MYWHVLHHILGRMENLCSRIGFYSMIVAISLYLDCMVAFFHNNTLYSGVIIIGDMDHVLHSFKIFCKNNPQNYYMYIFIRLTYRTTPLPMF